MKLFFKISLILLCFLQCIYAASLPKTTVRPARGCIALTFDDGPDPINTPQVLAILKKYHVKATWFVMGTYAKKYPDLIRQIQKDGHVIANHSWSHPYMTRISARRVNSEIYRTNNIIEQLTGVRPKCFRPPFGMSNPSVRAAIKRAGLHRIMWDVNSFDYERVPAKKLAKDVLKNTKARGGDVLLHDGYGNRKNTIAALPIIIEGALARGQRFVSICG